VDVVDGRGIREHELVARLGDIRPLDGAGLVADGANEILRLDGTMKVLCQQWLVCDGLPYVVSPWRVRTPWQRRSPS
jgi:hypothetical protein